MSNPPAVQQTALEAAGAIVSPTSLTFTRTDVAWDDLVNLAAFVGEVLRAGAWWVGDLVLFLEEHQPERVAQIDEFLGLAPQTIANRASVARHVPPSKRRSLPFGTHAEVAYMDPKERDRWLALAERGGWTRAQMRAEIARERAGQVVDRDVTGKNGPIGNAGSGGTLSGVPAPVIPGEPVLAPSLITCPHCGETVEVGG